MSTSPTSAEQPFDPFAGMASMNSTASEPSPPDDGYEPAVADPSKPSQAATATKEEDEDDLVIGQQLDAVGSPDQTSAAQPAVSHAGANTSSVDTPTADHIAVSTDDDSVSTSTAEQENQPDGINGQPGSTGGQIDPRMLAAAAAAEKAGQRQAGGGGGGLGLSGLIAGAATGAAGLIGGGFKMLGNGVKAVRGHSDPSLPRPLTVAERIATADPNKAEHYWQNAGDEAVREKLYRDAFHGMNSAVSEARAAERLFQEGVGDMREVLENSDVKTLADAAGTSVGDYINSVKSGTIKDAAAQAVVQTLEQSAEFKSAEDKIVSAGTTFAEKKDAALAKMKTIETSFPDRADTSLKKQQLSDIADGMKADDVSKASAKVKKIMDEIEAMANALKDAIRKAIDKVVSVFQPK
jgi:hypothetical protein